MKIRSISSSLAWRGSLSLRGARNASTVKIKMYIVHHEGIEQKKLQDKKN